MKSKTYRPIYTFFTVSTLRAGHFRETSHHLHLSTGLYTHIYFKSITIITSAYIMCRVQVRVQVGCSGCKLGAPEISYLAHLHPVKLLKEKVNTESWWNWSGAGEKLTCTRKPPNKTTAYSTGCYGCKCWKGSGQYVNLCQLRLLSLKTRLKAQFKPAWCNQIGALS